MAMTEEEKKRLQLQKDYEALNFAVYQYERMAMENGGYINKETGENFLQSANVTTIRDLNKTLDTDKLWHVKGNNKYSVRVTEDKNHPGTLIATVVPEDKEGRLPWEMMAVYNTKIDALLASGKKTITMSWPSVDDVDFKHLDKLMARAAKEGWVLDPGENGRKALEKREHSWAARLDKKLGLGLAPSLKQYANQREELKTDQMYDVKFAEFSNDRNRIALDAQAKFDTIPPMAVAVAGAPGQAQKSHLENAYEIESKNFMASLTKANPTLDEKLNHKQTKENEFFDDIIKATHPYHATANAAATSIKAQFEAKTDRLLDKDPNLGPPPAALTGKLQGEAKIDRLNSEMEKLEKRIEKLDLMEAEFKERLKNCDEMMTKAQTATTAVHGFDKARGTLYDLDPTAGSPDKVKPETETYLKALEKERLDIKYTIAALKNVKETEVYDLGAAAGAGGPTIAQEKAALEAAKKVHPAGTPYPDQAKLDKLNKFEAALTKAETKAKTLDAGLKERYEDLRTSKKYADAKTNQGNIAILDQQKAMQLEGGVTKLAREKIDALARKTGADAIVRKLK